MTHTAMISNALTELETVQGALEKIAARADEKRRHELIQLRRNLAEQINEMGKITEPFFATLADPETSRIYREKFARMRSATALHQANWPAVRLELSSREHKQSASAADEANRDFVGWMRKTLARLP